MEVELIRTLFPSLVVWAVAVNLAAFALMGIDKRRAVKGLWRVRESTLFLSAAVGGGIGAFLGMRAFRHKTKKTAFRIVMPALCVLYTAVYSLAILVFLRR